MVNATILKAQSVAFQVCSDFFVHWLISEFQNLSCKAFFFFKGNPQIFVPRVALDLEGVVYILLYGFIYYYFFLLFQSAGRFFFLLSAVLDLFILFPHSLPSNIFAVVILSIGDQKIIFPPLEL